MKKICLFIILLLIPIGFSANFKNYDVTYDTQTSKITINANIHLEENVSGLDFSVFTNPINLKVKSSEPIEYTTNGNNIAINFLQPTSGDISFKIEFETDLVDELEDRNIFSVSLSAPLDIENFRLSILLPQYSQVFYRNNNPLISPSPMIETDGKRIIVSWERELNAGETFSAVAAYTKPQKERSIIPIISFFSILTIAILIISYKHLQRKSHEPIFSAMSIDERKVFDLIRNNKGITQEEIRERTDFSKSKTSKLITNLERMDIIKKTPYKKTNRLESKL